jgi:hypothetical protein
MLSFLLKVGGMAHSPNYRKAYRAAKRELAQLLSEQTRIERRLVVVRQSIQTLAALCESRGIEVSPSEEADILLMDTALADEIRNILKAQYPNWNRPAEVRAQLQRLGHSLEKYSNPQASIQMVLKRMVESGEVQEEEDRDGKKTYRWMSLSLRAAAYRAMNPGFTRLSALAGLAPKRKFGDPPVSTED